MPGVEPGHVPLPPTGTSLVRCHVLGSIHVWSNPTVEAPARYGLMDPTGADGVSPIGIGFVS